MRLLSALFALLLACFASSALAQPKPFVLEKEIGETTSTLNWKIKKPRLPKGQVFDSIEIRGCWLSEGLKSIKVKNKAGKKVRAAKNLDNGTIKLKRVAASDFPLKVVTTFTGERAVVTANSSVVAYSVARCTKGKNACPQAKRLALKSVLDGAFCESPSDFEEGGSDATVVLADGDETEFFSTAAQLRFAVQGGAFLPDLTDATVNVGDSVFIAPEIALAGELLTVEGTPLVDGAQEVTITALDGAGRQLRGDFVVWAGANTLEVRVNNAAGQPVGEGTVKLELGDDKSVTQSLALSGGAAVFQNVPARTIALTVSTAQNEAGFLATTGDAGIVTIVVNGIGTPSEVANNDFSQGAAGWEFGSSPVTVVEHVEDVTGQTAPVTLAQEGPDLDLQLSTAGEGPQFMSRTFTTSPGTKAIIVRYRFVTSEFPGGYFGTRYNDYFNVAIRTLLGGGNVNDGNSMNALGAGAFEPSGSTTWRTARIPVARGGDTVQIDVAVANVADGAFGSQVIIDSVKETKFAITQSDLHDIDGDDLKYISAGNHPYFDRFTHIWGTIRVEGDKDDGLQNLELQLLDKAVVLQTARISTQASKKIIKKFGKAGFVEIKDPLLLFKLFPNDGTALDTEENRTFTLRIRATSQKGEVDEADAGSLDQLVLFDSNARYGPRDNDQGGDDWVTPAIRKVARELNDQGVTIGDISNMNGGKFDPHAEHRDGTDIDGWVTGYNARNAATAERLIELLNSPVGPRIGRLLVSFSRSDGAAFYSRIRNRELNDGRRADRVIQPAGDHETHFHMDLR